MKWIRIIEYESDLDEYSDARLRELLEEAEALRAHVIFEIRKRLHGPQGYLTHNLQFLTDDDRKRIEEAK